MLINEKLPVLLHLTEEANTQRVACSEKNQILKNENLQNETPNTFAEKSMPSPLLHGFQAYILEKLFF